MNQKKVKDRWNSQMHLKVSLAQAKQLKGKDLGEELLLSINMLKSDEPIFLDDMTVEQLQTALQIKVSIVESSGNDFVNCILNELREEV